MILGFLASLIGVLVGCRGGRKPADDPLGNTQRGSITVPTLVALPGRPLVVPMSALGLGPEDRFTLEADGRRLRSVESRWIAAEAPARTDAGSSMRWVEASSWRLAPLGVGPGTPNAPGVWILVIDLPATARELSTTGPSPRRVRIERELPPIPAIDRLQTSPDDLELTRTLIAPLDRDITQRWRGRLVRTRLGLDATGPETLDPILESLADQEQTRVWRALNQLAEADESLAASVVDVLTRCVRATDQTGAAGGARGGGGLGGGTDGGGLVPAWPIDPRADERLLAGLLLPDAAARIRAAETWLDAAPSASAIITDLAGLRNGLNGAPIATVHIANLENKPRLASVDLRFDGPDGPVVPDPVTVAPRAMSTIYLEGQPTPILLRGDTSLPTAIARMGPWSQSLGLWPLVSIARPPGTRLGPLFEDWRQATWLKPDPMALFVIPAASPTDARLSREETPTGERWRLSIECAHPPEASANLEAVRIWLGPTGQPLAVIQIPRVGASKVEVGGRDANSAAAGVCIASLKDRWLAQIDLPTTAIERDGTIRIGLERLDRQGVRSASPLPMFPWQLEPGRWAISTIDWMALPQSPEDQAK
jgi:hypothetical protein